MKRWEMACLLVKRNDLIAQLALSTGLQRNVVGVVFHPRHEMHPWPVNSANQMSSLQPGSMIKNVSG